MISPKNVLSRFLSSSITFTPAPTQEKHPYGKPPVTPDPAGKKIELLQKKKKTLIAPLDRQLNQLQKQQKLQKMAAPIPTTVTSPGQPQQQTQLTPQQLRTVKNTLSDESLAQNVIPLTRISNLANKIVLDDGTSAAIDTAIKSRLGGSLKTGFLGLVYESGAWGVMAKR